MGSILNAIRWRFLTASFPMRLRRGLLLLATCFTLALVWLGVSYHHTADYSRPWAVPSLVEVVDNDIQTVAGMPLVDGVENATFFTLCRNSDMTAMLASIKSVEERFNNRHHYPWVFANNEKFTDIFKEKVTAAVSGEVTFTTVPPEYWDIPEWVDMRQMSNGMMKLEEAEVLYATSESYRQMCRFNSGFFYKLKALEPYKWYWRVEPDVKFACNLPEDPFLTLSAGDKLYGFTLAMVEIKETITSLWEVTRAHFESRPWWTPVPEGSDETIPNTSLGFIEQDIDKRRRVRGQYNYCHYWSNYEVGSLDFFRGEEYNLYFDALDRTGNFFYERWGDAPIHSMALSYLLPPEKIHYFDNTGYHHGKIGNCPRDREYFKEHQCHCNRRTEFSWRSWSCVPRWFDGLGIEKPNKTH